MIKVCGLCQERAVARQRSFVAVLAAALLGGGAASCAPDQTSFFDLNASGDTSRDGARAPIYPLVGARRIPASGHCPRVRWMPFR